MPGSGNKGNFYDVLASLIFSKHGCFTTVNIRKRMLYRQCYISFLQAQAVPINLIQLYSELMKRTTKPNWIGNQKRQYYRRTYTKNS